MRTWCRARRSACITRLVRSSAVNACSSTLARILTRLVSPITGIIRQMSADQIVERAATLEDVRAEVLTPDRLNTLVFGGFAAVALLIAVVGVAGVLAFSVSGRTREFGIRLAIGSQPRHLLTGVIAEGAVMAAIGVIAGAVCGYALARLAGTLFPGRAAAGRPAGNRLGDCAVSRRGGRIHSAGGPRGARRRHAGSKIGLTSSGGMTWKLMF